MKRYLSLIIFFLVVISFQVQAQSPDSLKRLLENYSIKFPQEKLYIHLDKPSYSPGDTIWFKAYLTDAVFHLPDSVSKIIYVDLIRRENGQLIRHKLLWNQGGFANGEFCLSDSLSAGQYELVGYTNYMKNFSEGLFFRKEIMIYRLTDIKKGSEDELSQFSNIADLQFFPEGGNLIAGLQNRVAFKAVNKYGKGVDVKAFIVSEKGDTVVALASQHLGMGSFIFKPSPAEKYFAILPKSPNQKQFALPEALTSGYALMVDNLTNKDFIKVTARNNEAVKDRPILIGHQRGDVVFAVQGSSDGNSFTWSLPKGNIGNNGVIQLTLFNGKGVPQCERLIYNGDETPMQISITSDKAEYLPREKVVLSIHAKDRDNNPVVCNFSVSITDSGQVTPETNGENLYSYLYLTSDVEDLTRAEVRGVIEQPGHYFNTADPNALVHLDILLMTQGWRRFLWRDVLGQKNSALPYEIEQGVTVQGKAVLTNGKKPGKPIFLSLFYSNGNEPPKYLFAAADLEGAFTFWGLEARNETTVFIQDVRDKAGRNANFSIDKPAFPVYKGVKVLIDPLLFDGESYNTFIQQHSRMMEMNADIAQNKVKLLKEVQVTGVREKKSDPRKVMYEGTHPTTVVVSAQMCATAISILQLIQGRVAGIEVKQDSMGGFYITVRGPKSIVQRNPEVVGVLVDGVVMDLQILNTIPPCAVESIDVITHPVSSLNVPGLISVLTKGGNSSRRDWSQEAGPSEPGTLVAKIPGYDVPREFYSPKYPLTTGTSSQPVQDFRSTLFWGANIKTDRNGNATVVFWNSDEHTSIRVSLEGISVEGKPGCAVYQYQIK